MLELRQGVHGSTQQDVLSIRTLNHKASETGMFVQLLDCSLSTRCVQVGPVSPLRDLGIVQTHNTIFLTCVKVGQSCPTLCDRLFGVLPARILEWVAVSFPTQGLD